MVRQGILGLAILGLYAALFGQQSALLNFFASAGGCELDYDKDGCADGWAMFHEGIAPEHTILSLDTAIRFAGAASQRVRLQRSAGSAGRFVIFVGVNFNAHLKPSAGEPLLVRLALRAEGFQNASYTVYVFTGSRRVELLPATRQDTGGWRQLSAVVPVESDASGAPQFSLRIEIQASEGAASGTLWIDEAQALSTRAVIRMNRLPNGLRLAYTYLYRNPDPYRYLDLPFGVVTGVAIVGQTLQYHHPDVMWMPYCYMPATMIPSSYRHNADLYNYDDVNA
jgi:hypothetical protein